MLASRAIHARAVRADKRALNSLELRAGLYARAEDSYRSCRRGSEVAAGHAANCPDTQRIKSAVLDQSHELTRPRIEQENEARVGECGTPGGLSEDLQAAHTCVVSCETYLHDVLRPGKAGGTVVENAFTDSASIMIRRGLFDNIYRRVHGARLSNQRLKFAFA
jgi:hypothetical protein